jgi:hypothetical protein
MSILTAPPFNYAFNDLVIVQVTSTNSFGTGPYSLPNTSGATIRQIPSQPNPAFLVSRTMQTMTINWLPLVGT